MVSFVTAGDGFLLAVLWFDLMHDVLVRTDDPAGIVTISSYYRRVTTDARPMNRLVAIVMIATCAAIAAEIIRGATPGWATWPALVLNGTAVTLAAVHTVPNAVRLGAMVAHVDGRGLARSIYRDHVVCFALVGAALAMQLAAAR